MYCFFYCILLLLLLLLYTATAAAAATNTMYTTSVTIQMHLFCYCLHCCGSANNLTALFMFNIKQSGFIDKTVSVCLHCTHTHTHSLHLDLSADAFLSRFTFPFFLLKNIFYFLSLDRHTFIIVLPFWYFILTFTT